MIVTSLGLSIKHRALLWKVASYACFAVMAALIRFLATFQDDPLPPVELAFFEFLFGGACLLLLRGITWRNMPSPFSIPWTKLIVIRSFIATAGITLWCVALKYAPLPMLSVFKLLGPVITVVAAHVFLKETYHPGRFWALILGLLGTALLFWHQFQYVLQPWNPTASIWSRAWVPFAALLLLSCSHLFAKKILKTFSPWETTFGLLWWGTLFLLLPTCWVWVTPMVQHLPWLGALGLCSGLAYICLHQALQLADLSYLMPLSIVRFAFGTFLGYCCFGETLPPLLVAAVGGVVWITVGLLRHEKPEP